ncbi:hypothetical protein N8T08_001690 [Aspergillus melleus]|uniref:Uncharacterized protein n=1 Tax=Aspergillus melleus TaxID=138277 RepID=A0ACC3AN76_9EURO|nr:hypothetical protein N8T08_001690 [Aspergillus melleus]
MNILTPSAHGIEARASGQGGEKTAPSPYLVDWYNNNDPGNPQNWSGWRKAFVTFQICIYTLAVYMGSAIHTPSEAGVRDLRHGPLIFSPLSEIPAIGRNWPCIGFFGSPALATGAALVADIYPMILLPYAVCLWAMAATSGPALGPVISGFSVPAESWRWSLWEILWLAGRVLVVMIPFTRDSSHNILRRAQRLRKLTGNSGLRSRSELLQATMTARDVAFEALVRPMQLMIMDPAIGYIAGYAALCYAIY